jgi:CRISPR-associated protein Csm3
MSMKLVEYVPITGTLICKTGLRIGGSKDEISIGEMDNPIIRHPITRQPYIPGSSIKGKLRSLCEYREGKISADGQPHGQHCASESCLICRIFGPHKNTTHKLGPSRLIVRDALLTEKSKNELQDAQESKGVYFAEVKTENWINRLSSAAGDPRTQERVPAGTEFELHLSLRVFETDTRDDVVAYILEALRLLEHDTLGGSGTRGYGWVKIKGLKPGDPVVVGAKEAAEEPENDEGDEEMEGGEIAEDTNVDEEHSA